MQIPDLKPAKCLLLSACGRIVTKDPDVISRIKAFKRKAAEFEGSRLIAWGGGSGDDCDTHLHIDVVSKNLRGLPSVNSTVAEIQGMLDKFIGQSIAVRVIAGFTVPTTDLPERGLIRGTMLAREFPEISIKQSGATFMIERGPVERIEWELSKNATDSVDVELTAKQTVPFDNEYLLQLLEFSRSAFEFLILGRKP